MKVSIDKLNGKYPGFAIVQVGRTSVSGYLIMRVGKRLSKTEVSDVMEYDTNIPALSLVAAKKQLEELINSEKVTEMDKEIKATCQVCGRLVKAGSGLIAHHGYKRPYEGWQTASCMGARYLPYEVSCERLREVVEIVRSFIVSQEEALASFIAMPPQTITVSERRGSYERAKEATYQKPEGFTYRENAYYGIPRTYENAYSNKRGDYTQTIRLAKADLLGMEKRLNAWKAC